MIFLSYLQEKITELNARLLKAEDEKTGLERRKAYLESACRLRDGELSKVPLHPGMLISHHFFNDATHCRFVVRVHNKCNVMMDEIFPAPFLLKAAEKLSFLHSTQDQHTPIYV